jgi:tripartite-type tricarboxylate transporter receptor subunit TctC
MLTLALVRQINVTGAFGPDRSDGALAQKSSSNFPLHFALQYPRISTIAPSSGRHMQVRKLAAVAVITYAIVFGWITTLCAEGWPQRPVRFIIPFGPGAGADIGARLIQEGLQKRWGKPIIIENRPGGDSMVAIQAFLHANDDHTFLWSASGNFTVHPTLYKNLPYDPADIVPIARYSNTILAVGVPTSMNISTLKEFVDRARAAPGKFNGTAVPGTTDLAFDYFAKAEKLMIAKVPYRNTVQAATDLGEGRIQVYASSYAILRPVIESGRIRALAVMGRERAPSLPKIPSAFEEGYPALEMEGLVGLFGIRDMSPELRERIADDIIAVSRDPTVINTLNATGQTPNPGGPKEFGESIERQRQRIAIIAKEIGITPEQ